MKRIVVRFVALLQPASGVGVRSGDAQRAETRCREIDNSIHRAMQDTGEVKPEEHSVRVLNARQDLMGPTGSTRKNCEQGDVIRYSKGSKPLGIEAGEYAQVVRADAKANTVTVERKNSEELSYEPRRLQGVTV